MTPLARMLALCAGALFLLKIAVTLQARAERKPLPSPGWWLGFAFAWPGMRPELFASRSARSGAGTLVGRGLARMAAGGALFAAARLAWEATGSRVVASALLLPALSLLLHFGLFNLLAGVWRAAGVDVAPPFDAPHRSRSLQEFWARRWNLAFSEMTAAIVYRPLARRFGRGAGLAGAFLLSGLLHEMAISVPVMAGFGGPMVYFALHGVLVAVERKMARPPGALWTAFWLVAPLPLLFHAPFLRGVLWPLVGIE